MFLQVKNFIKERKRICFSLLQIMVFPFLMIVVSVLIKAIFNLGTYTGSFIRNIFELVA